MLRGLGLSEVKSSESLDRNPIISQVNTNLENIESSMNPRTANLANGNYVTIWGAHDPEYYSDQPDYVLGQQYNTEGNPVGGQFEVRSSDHTITGNVAVSGLSNGGFVVTWVEFTSEDDRWDIFCQRYDSDSNKVGDAFIANNPTVNEQLRPSVLGLSDDGFVIIYDTDLAPHELKGQKFDLNGNPIGEEFQINSSGISPASINTISPMPDGGFIASWTSNSQIGSNIIAQRYDANADKVGLEFTVNTNTDGTQTVPSFATISDNNFIAVWQSNSDICGQLFDSELNPKGSEFIVGSGDGFQSYQSSPSVINLSDGSFVIAWSSNHTGEYGIYAQEFDSEGNPIASELELAETSSSKAPSLARLPNGGHFILD